MKTFNHTVALRMEAGGLDPRDTEDKADLCPNRGHRLSTAVRGEQGRNTKLGDPGRDKSSSTGFRCDGGQQNGLRPSGGSVNHS